MKSAYDTGSGFREATGWYYACSTVCKEGTGNPLPIGPAKADRSEGFYINISIFIVFSGFWANFL